MCSVVLKWQGTQRQGEVPAHELVGTRIRLRGPSVRSVILKKSQDTQQQGEARHQQGEAQAIDLVGTRTSRL